MLLERIQAACESLLPDATVIIHGSLALGDYRHGVSDVDMLILSDATLNQFPDAVADAWTA